MIRFARTRPKLWQSTDDDDHAELRMSQAGGRYEVSGFLLLYQIPDFQIQMPLASLRYICLSEASIDRYHIAHLYFSFRWILKRDVIINVQ